MTPEEIQFSSSDLERIRRGSFVQTVDFHREIGSTNDRAAELADWPAERLPALVLAESQTAGRGRGANRWWASRGALTFTAVLDADAMQLPAVRWPQVALTAGLAVCEALEELLGDEKLVVGLKWPNDVYVEGRKICGVLVEGPSEMPGRLLLGIGINVNNSVAEAPKELEGKATAFCDLLGRRVALAEVLVLVLQKLGQHLAPSGFWSQPARDAWRQRCLLTGRTVQIDLPQRQISGVCLGIDDEGALQVDSEGKVERCFSGVVTSWE